MHNVNQVFVDMAEKAVAYDKSGHLEAAIHSYVEVAETISHLVEEGRLPLSYKETAGKYFARADTLKQQVVNAVAPKRKDEINLERAEFLVSEAASQSDAGKLEEAKLLYVQAAEFCLTQSRSGVGVEERQHYLHLAQHSLDRAEKLKGKSVAEGSSGLTSNSESRRNSSIPVTGMARIQLSDGQTTQSITLHPSATFNLPPADADNRRKGRGELDENELKVLATTSKINDRVYLPFMPHDVSERFAYSLPFTDKDGMLKLSDKQRKRLKCWVRPDEFMEEPAVIDCIDSGTIKQTVVSDCSFVASLAVAARYERRFGTQLITNIIYPQNKNGQPIHNPCGKYMVKLHINGISRKVVIDDLLPMGGHGELLCSYSQRKNELWVSLLEKAYMKVMGGYDFPGSNSNIDLHALTGWVPERIPIRSNPQEFNADKTFERLFSRFHQGHCLITLATGQLSEAEQERTGLVDAHAYAVLDLRKFEDKRLLLLKNPWTHLRWKGNFSERDRANWTAEMQRALDYKPSDAQQFDDGVFWIDYASVCRFFDVFYCNWNPALFPFSHVLHASWDAGLGPVKDLYTIGDNPQYCLEVNNTTYGAASVWILLTRHITDKADFADNREYITVIIYKSDGRKIYVPYDPKPLVEGVRINSPHYLCQLLIKEEGVQRYTLVVAQYEKTSTIFYSLRIYSSAEFKCGPIRSTYRRKKKEAGEWKGKTAGGCGNGSSRDTYLNNPTYHITLEDGSDENQLLIDLRAPKEFSVGFDVNQVSSYRHRPFERRDSGSFRPGFTYAQLGGVPSGCYAVRAMTFLQGQEGPFILRVECSCDFTMKRVQ